MQTLDAFTLAYIEAALWSSSDTRPGEEEPRPLDDDLGSDDIAQETLDKMIADCARFQAENAADIAAGAVPSIGCTYSDVERAGHDFWLTRNGHGCGFWDGTWAEPAASRLTAASKAYGEHDLYIGDDGKVYC